MTPETLRPPEYDAMLDDRLQQERAAVRYFFNQFIERHQAPQDGTIGQLTTWQSDALRSIGSVLMAEETVRARCDIACGGGKTPLAIYTAKAMGAGLTRPDGTKRQILFCTSRNGIVGQLSNGNAHNDTVETMSDFQYFAPELCPSVYNKDIKDVSGDVVIMPYASLPHAIERGDIWPGRFSAFLLDEAHAIGALTWSLLEANSAGMTVLGFSATPGKTVTLLPEKIKSVTALDGIMKYKFLSSTRLLGVETGQVVRRNRARGSDFYPSDIAPLTLDESRAEKILDIIRFGASTLGPGWIKCHPRHKGVDHVVTVAEMVNNSDPIIDMYGNKRQLRVEPVGRFRRDSDEVIEEFIKSDTIDAVAFVRLLGEGYNIPKFRWGLWTPPTLCYDPLEQAVGRGNRRDSHDPNKIFTFFQLVDIGVSEKDRLALAWELFGVDRDVREVITIDENGIGIGGETLDGTYSNLTIPEFLKHSIERVRRVPLRALDIASTPLEPEKVVHSLAKMQSITGLERDWMRRVLFHGGFSGTAAFDHENNEELDFFYEEDSLGFLLDAVAQEEDLEISKAAALLGISERNLRAQVDDYGFDFTYLYPNEADAWCVPRLHLRGQTLEQILTIRGVRREVLDTEITMAEVADRTGIRQNKLRTYLETRGYNLKGVNVKGRSSPDIVGDRDQIEPWIKAYIRAAAAPAKGFVQLASFCRNEIGGEKPHLSEVFEATRQAGVKTWIFRLRVERKDYIERPYSFVVAKALERIVKNRADTSSNSSHSPQLEHIRKSIATSDKAIVYHAQRLGFCIDNLQPDNIENLKRAIFTARRDLAVFQDEPALIEAVGGQARTLFWPQAPKRTTGLSLGTQENRHIEVQDQVYQQYPVHQRVLEVILEKHPTVSHYPVKRDKTSRVIIDTELRSILDAVLKRSGIKPQDIPATWSYVGDIAQQLRMHERDLMGFLVSKNIGPSHIRFIEISSVRGIFAFCSPELAQKLTCAQPEKGTHQNKNPT